jgi:elongation factor P--(R)-beta-lysine ligase
MTRSSRRLAPSDLASRPASSQTITIGGRVAHAVPGELRIADAFTNVVARGAKLDAQPGDLLLLRGRWDGTKLGSARVIERVACPTPNAEGEFARLSWQGVGPRLRARSQALAVIREYFARQHFVEVDPPQRVRAPGVDQHVDALRAQGGYLVTSPELALKRLLVGGIPRLYSLTHAFRRDEQGSLHEPEFLLLEWYRAFAGQDEVQGDTEELVVAIARALRGKRELMTPGGRRLDLRTPFPRLSVKDAFARHAGVRDVASLAAEDEARYFELFVDRVEPALAKLDRPLFLHDYPLSQAALARPTPEDPRFAERFELYAGGIELCNGYGELTDPLEQRRRFEAERLARKKAQRPVYPIDRRFLRALSEGMPPSGGNALGVDRLILLATGAKSIQDVLPLPWERG